MKSICDKCKKEHDLDQLEWFYFSAKGYREKKVECGCGHTQYVYEPFSKEKRSFWENVKQKVGL